MKNIIVLTNPRSGSRYLCDILKHYGYNSKYWFEPLNSQENYAHNKEVRDLLFKDPNTLIESLPKEDELAKIHYFQFFVQHTIDFDFDRFFKYQKSIGTKFIILYREDVFEQIVSEKLCLVDKKWVLGDHRIKVDLTEDELNKKYKIHKEKNDFYISELEKHDINYEKIAYIESDFKEEDIKRLVEFVGLEYNGIKTNTKKQRKKDITQYIKSGSRRFCKMNRNKYKLKF